MKKIKYILTAFAWVLISCNPYQFSLNTQSENPIEGLIMSDMDSVVKTADNELMLHGGGIAAIRVEEITQMDADFTVRILSGRGIRFSFRTISNDYLTKPGLSCDFTTSGSVVSYNNNLIAKVDSIKAELIKPSRVHIKNDGYHYFVTVDCDTVIHSSIRDHGTEYIIFRSLDSSKIRLSGIKIEKLVIVE